MLVGACITLGNRHSYTIFVDTDLIYSKLGGGGCEVVSFPWRWAFKDS